MGGKLGKKELSVAYEKLIASRVEEEITQTAVVKPKQNEEVHLAAELMGPTTEKRDNDADGMKDTGLVANEEQLVASISDEATKSPEADLSQLLEVTTTKGVKRQEEDAE